jgi:tubulin-specific chaperone D
MWQFKSFSAPPQLCEPYLFDPVHPLVHHLRGFPPVFVRINAASDVLYILSIVCGPKSIVKVFPHEVCDLEPALQLWKCESEEISWQTRYILLIWMSMLVMIPFDISSIESAKLLFKEDVIQECIHMLHSTTKVQEGAAFLLSRILTRPDMVKSNLPSFFELCCREMSMDDVVDSTVDDPSMSRRIIIGCLQTLANIFKIGVREELQPFVEIIASRIFALARKTRCTTTRKYCVKVIQRIGMVYLKPRIAKWRYQRGARSLLDTLRKSKGAIRTNVKQDGQAQSLDQKKAAEGEGEGEETIGLEKDKREKQDKEEEEDKEEDYEIPDELEDVIDVLLLGLCDRNTVVRWSAAKGIGRITMRLPKELANDVVSTVLDLFKPSQGDHAWHGGCLALAELARRGLFLPDRLDVAVPIVIQALQYDVPRGAHSVGSHVRDAACYVCWSFARAYAPTVMQPHVADLGCALLILSSLDREVNCRRAAAAAFQENVGRQGTFPHGIEIITAADYYTLSNRKRSYLEIAPFVGKFETYRTHFIAHLVHVKLCHWDATIRELAAKSLAEFADVDATSIFDEIVPELLESALDTDLLVRHGAVLGLSEVLGRGLPPSPVDDEKNISKAAELRKSLALLVPRIDQARLYRGKGGELMRAAVSGYILSLSRSGIKLPRKLKMTGTFGPRAVMMNPLKVHQDTLDENLKHPKEEISESAMHAFKEFSKAYYPEWSDAFNKEVLSVYASSLIHVNIHPLCISLCHVD